MFMGNPEIGSRRADDFYTTGLACAIRLATRRFAEELAIDHAGPKERKAAEKRLRQLELEFEALKQGVENRVRQMALIIHTIHSEALYRVRGQTFDEYIRKQRKWQQSRQRAYQLLKYGRMLQELTTHVVTLPSDAQARVLGKLPPPEWLPAWRQAVETSSTLGRVTMAHLEKIVHASRSQVERPTQGISAEEARIVATLRRWKKQGNLTSLSNIRRECDDLLPPGVGA
jgi:hypothetical protein